MTTPDINYFVDKIDELISEMSENEEELYLIIEMAHNIREELLVISADEEDETE